MSENRGNLLVHYIATARTRTLPPEVHEAALRALVDFLGVSLGAVHDPCVVAVQKVVQSWAAPGRARIFLGPLTEPALAVLVNSTMTHAMDFDDAHPMGAGHPSGPCWSTTLALAQQHGASEATAISAFLAGFEVMARLGGGGYTGVGRNLQRRGFHPTAMFGRMGAAAAASVMLDLTPDQIASALGVAATTAGGLLGSFGTHAKPFHSGKAAMDGVMAAELAANGFLAAHNLYEVEGKGALLPSFIQDHQVDVPPLDFATSWEILGNAYKPYASCRGTHPAVQAARALADKLGTRPVAKVHVRVHPGGLVTAGRMDPQTLLEGKFSIAFCVALALAGHQVQADDFRGNALEDPRVQAIRRSTTVEAVEGQPNTEAHVVVTLAGGEELRSDVAVMLGHPLNPMSWEQIHAKFTGLVAPVLGAAPAARLYEVARHFDQPGALAELNALIAPTSKAD